MRRRHGAALQRARAANACLARPPPAQDHVLLGLVEVRQGVGQVDGVPRNAGRVVSKHEISEQALGRPLARFDRSIDVHLSAIRQKLGDGARMIRTVRGLGYHLARE